MPLNPDAQRTANLVKVHRAVGIATKPRIRLPRQVWPRMLELEYAKAIGTFYDRARVALAPLEQELPGLIASADTSRRLDAHEGRRAQQLIDHARDRMRTAIAPGEVETLARKAGHRVLNYQGSQLQRQIRAGLGIDVHFRDKQLASVMEHFVSENVSRIRSIPSEVHDDVEKIVTGAIASGRSHKHIAEEIDRRFEVGKYHARRIARDQVGKLYGRANKHRQKEIGIEKFIWRTVGDEKVRDEHADLEDEVFDWDDPPEIDGEPTEPGEDIQCRCYGEPVFGHMAD